METTTSQKVKLVNAALYRVATFGIYRTDCRKIEIETGPPLILQHVAPGGRTTQSFTLDDRNAWLVVLPLTKAITPDSALVADDSGVQVARYGHYDLQYRRDFEAQLRGGLQPLFSVGLEGQWMTPENTFSIEGDELVCRLCEAGIREESSLQHLADHVTAGWVKL